jgi:hypothetical protein
LILQTHLKAVPRHRELSKGSRSQKAFRRKKYIVSTKGRVHKLMSNINMHYLLNFLQDSPISSEATSEKNVKS